MDHRRPALRLLRLRLRTTSDQTQLDDAGCTLNTINQPDGQSQRAPKSPLNLLVHTSQDSRSITTLPYSPPNSPVSSNGGLNSPVGSTTSSVGSYSTARSSLPRTPPALRRKISPTETSLREIRAKQQRLQTKQSDDQLRQVYERQTMEYLYGDFASLDTLRE